MGLTGPRSGGPKAAVAEGVGWSPGRKGRHSSEALRISHCRPWALLTPGARLAGL